MDNNLQQAITLIKSGDKKGGGQLLAEIVKKDPRNVNAWLWLSSCVNTDEQRIYCLKKVLEIDPNNQATRNVLQKLQQPEQPTEKELLGVQELPAQNGYQAVEHFQGEQSKGINSLPTQSSDKQSSFQPKYLTAVAGIGSMLGTIFTWAVEESQARGIINQYSGWTEIHGLFTFVVGLVIILLAFFGRTKPGKTNSPISSVLAIVTLLANFIWVIESHCADLGAYFGDPNAVCYDVGKGFGYNLSMFSLFLAFIFGLIPNPKNQISD